MLLSSIQISNFRNLESLVLRPAPGVNLISGENASGKTSVLEAIFFCCTAKSFRGAPDRVLQRRDSEVVRIEARGMLADKEVEVAIAWGAGEKKQVKVDGVRLTRLADLFDYFHAVSFVPEDAEIILGPPAMRRHLLDLYISQGDRSYLKDLFEYNRVLAQRNALLRDFSIDEEHDQQLRMLEVWDEQLAPVAARIVRQRIGLLSICGPTMKEYYRRISGNSCELCWKYEGSIDPEQEDLGGRLGRKLKERRRRDLYLGTTSVGPHRDDVAIYLDGVALRAYASQGEAKSAALAIKLAVYEYLSERIGERPLLLLDEFGSQLDPRRTASLLQILPDLGQVFLTSARREQIRGALSIQAEMRLAGGRLFE